jgi:hypothetical protein
MNFDYATKMAHMKFISKFSAEEFSEWITNAAPENSQARFFEVVANSSKITFRAESEPFLPISEEDDFMLDFDQT